MYFRILTGIVLFEILVFFCELRVFFIIIMIYLAFLEILCQKKVKQNKKYQTIWFMACKQWLVIIVDETKCIFNIY